MKPLTLFVLLLAPYGALAAERIIQEQYALNEGGLVRLSIPGADVRIEGGEGSQVALTIEIRGSHAFVDNLEVNIDSQPRVLEIVGKKRQRGRMNWGQNRVQVHLRVPRHCETDVKTSGGNVEADHLEGDQALRTSGGDITVTDLTGKLEIHTSGGEIRARMCHGPSLFHTSGGDISILESSGNMNVSTSGGDIRMETSHGAIDAHTSGGDVWIQQPEGFETIEARTSGGNIDIQLEPGIRASLRAHTSGGSIRCDLPVTVQGEFKKTRLQGDINGGGAPLTLSTSGGSIRIKVL